MLDQISTEWRQTAVFRMVGYHGDTEFLQEEIGFDQERIDEVTELLKATGTVDSRTNLPVFVRSALSDPRRLRLVSVQYDPS